MNQIVPPRFLFRWSFNAIKIENVPRSSGRLLDLPSECELPSLETLDQRPNFAQVRLAWNDGGVGISVAVFGRSRQPELSLSEDDIADGIRLWFDTRHTQSVHRATKYCHQFSLHPTGGGPKKADPIVRSLAVARAREDSPLPNSQLVKIQSRVSKTEYWLDAWFPAEVFTGFDPKQNPRIGFHYVIHDSELGDQTLAVGREFPVESDPSLWQTIELNQ